MWLTLSISPFGKTWRAREGHAAGVHAVALGRPHDQAAPPAADVEEPLARLEPQLPAHEVELVLLRLVEVAVGAAVVGAGVDHAPVEEEGVELVRRVVVIRDRPGVEPLRAESHGVTRSRTHPRGRDAGATRGACRRAARRRR